ncbi:MAG TPA: hypothetical protein VGP93_07265 [Polyangiaceae bacterium]|nr:hypothetical protein [Polyangiaceae bacterium]
MPYPLSLQAFTPPEFYRQAPESWTRRLKEIAPEMPGLDTLVFRYFEPTEPDGEDRGWIHNERGQWTLYTAKPIRMVTAERAKDFELHWSERPLHPESAFPECEQMAYRSICSDYQHFMWHNQGVYVQPFLILQGPMGGTPMKYTPAETAFLQASDCISEPFDIGTFEACPFDERVVKTIAMRNRLLQVENDLAALARLDTPENKKGEAAAAQLLKRNTHLDTMAVMLAPSIEFMKLRGSTKSVVSQLPPAPAGLAEKVARWKDHWLEHGVVLGAGPAPHKKLQVAVL